ncbi:MAG: SpaA isopeptide-forming pilin-related protein [Bacilli bacterium]
MKVNLKKCLFVMALMIGTFIGVQNVSAATLNMTDSGYFYDRAKGDGSDRHSWNWRLYDIDGNVAYCIEPNVVEGTYYLQGSWSDTGLSDAIKERVLLTAYYGYTYPNHQTLKYRAATQGIIWDTIIGSGSHTTFSTARWSAGTALDISAERAEIERLITNHYVKPSFNGATYDLQVGQSITLHDDNEVLGNYNVSVSGANYSINGNDLTLTPTTNGNVTIILKKNMPYDDNYKIFYGNGVQNMLVPGTVDPVVATVKVNSYYGSVEINKMDSQTEIAQGQATLKGAIYGVFKNDGTLLTKITTDENGYGKSDAVLSYDSYYIQEISPSKGYYLDETRYVFESKGQAVVKKDVYENVIKNYISILKQYDFVDGNTTFLNAEKGIIFEIFYPSGEKWGEVETDKNGYATIEIPYGVWKFHQVNTTTGFEKIYDFFITIDENSEKEQYYNILNNKISAYLQVFKIDSETKETIALADTTFKILNTDTNQYVSQYVGGKIYDTFKTDENGKFITYLKLEAGNYKLIEITSPNNYLLNSEGMTFTIGNDTHYSFTTYGAFITLYFENQVIKGKIEVNKTGEVPVIENGTYTYDKKPLEGVVFEIYANEDILSSDGNHLYYSKGELVDTIISNSNGYAISKELYLGNYYLVEVKTLNNMVLNTEKYYFTLSEIDNKTNIVYESYSALNLYKKGELEFSKTDLTTGQGVADTKIEIFYINENTNERELVFTGATDEEGNIKITDLFVGKFVIIETEAATGYRLSDEEIYFEIKENGEIVKANMTNEKITSVVGIHKVDENGNPIKGVTIGVYDLSGNLIYSGVSNENGNIEFTLEYGSYYFQELATLDEFELSSEKVYFDVTEDGAYIQKTLVNELKEIEVPNTSSNTYIDIIAGTIVLLGASLIIISSKRKKK